MATSNNGIWKMITAIALTSLLSGIGVLVRADLKENQAIDIARQEIENKTETLQSRVEQIEKLSSERYQQLLQEIRDLRKELREDLKELRKR